MRGVFDSDIKGDIEAVRVPYAKRDSYRHSIWAAFSIVLPSAAHTHPHFIFASIQLSNGRRTTLSPDYATKLRGFESVTYCKHCI
jgi:hypothetical protein